MPVYPLSEGTFSVNADKTFIPFIAGKDFLKDRPSSLIVDIVPFLVINGSERMVIDPGLGLLAASGAWSILDNLQQLGYQPDEITHVLLSHLHKDHAGGIAYVKNGAYNLMFPSAQYYCQDQELQYALGQGTSPSYEIEKLEFLSRHPNLNRLQGDGMISTAVRCEVCNGHTPFHQVFYLQLQGRQYFYGGDVVPQPSQVIRRFVAKYDFNGRAAAERRSYFARQAAMHRYACLFFHDHKLPVGLVVEEKGKLRVIPAEAE